MHKVLVADDDPAVRALCRVILRKNGFEVLEAAGAPACIAMTRRLQPDLVLLDWMMPGVNGVEALRILKGTPATRAIPVVMLTAIQGQAEIAGASEAGADGYVTKPFDARNLLELVERFIITARPQAVA